MKTFILGIEGGGTKTTWCLVDENENFLAQGKAGPGNVSLMSDEKLKKLFEGIAKVLPYAPSCVGAGMAGVMKKEEGDRVNKVLKKVFPKVKRIEVREDSDSGFYAAHGKRAGVLVIAGTGSNVMVSNGKREVKLGGWGHIAGDWGSAWHLAQLGVQGGFAEYDRRGKVGRLARFFLKEIGSTAMVDLAYTSLGLAKNKSHFSRLAKVVLICAKQGDLEAKGCVDQALAALSQRVEWGMKRLGLKLASIALIGGMFEYESFYRDLFYRSLKKKGLVKDFFVCRTPGALGATRFFM